MFQQLNSILADDEIAVAFSDGGGQTCGRDGGMGSVGGGGGSRGCKPSPDPQKGCDVIGMLSKVPGVKNVTPAKTGAALCNAGANAIRAGQSRTERAINEAVGKTINRSWPMPGGRSRSS